MSSKRAVVLSVGGVLLVVLVAAAFVFEPWKLVIDETVAEGDDPSRVVGTASGGLTATADITDTAEGVGDGSTRILLASAPFIDAEHATSGTATIYLRSDGTRFLRLVDLDTSNGPDLHVWLTDQTSGGDCAGCDDSWGIYDDGRQLRLGELKGNLGSQNYEIPDDADLSDMASVVIWCDRFNVAFGTAAIA